MRKAINVSTSLLGACVLIMPMLGCDPNQVGNQTQSAARGTRDAVRSTKTGIEKAQEEASKAADEISSGKKPEAPKPVDDGRPKPAPKPALPPSSPANP